MVTEDFTKLWTKLTKDWKLNLEQSLAPLTEGQLNVLELLTEEEMMKPSDFLDHLSTSPAAVTTLLDRMEKNGLIVRTRDEQDRRVVWITPTSKGQLEVERGRQVRSQMIAESLDRISEHNQQLLVYLLGKVASS